jgi:hypothetical protein
MYPRLNIKNRIGEPPAISIIIVDQKPTFTFFILITHIKFLAKEILAEKF